MRYISELFKEEYSDILDKQAFSCYRDEVINSENGKYKVNILALGDVGSTLLMGLKLLGGDIIEQIGIFDISENIMKRFEMELNQISWPFAAENGIENSLPNIKILNEEELFDCHMFLFCASKSVPKVGDEKIDVRMTQYEENSKLVSHFANKAKESGFEGIFSVVSDPVDPLCKAAVKAGLNKGQVKGFGLGVMNARAMYFAKQDEKMASYLVEGRAFGPHGEDLVIANSIENYNDEISKKLTKLTVESNLVTRRLGFKPYIAPAMSSGAMSIISLLRGDWHYSSLCFGDGFLGAKNKMTKDGMIVENKPLPDELYTRIEKALKNLENLK